MNVIEVPSDSGKESAEIILERIHRLKRSPDVKWLFGEFEKIRDEYRGRALNRSDTKDIRHDNLVAFDAVQRLLSLIDNQEQVMKSELVHRNTDE